MVVQSEQSISLFSLHYNYFVSTDWQEILPPKMTKNLQLFFTFMFCHYYA